MSDYNDASGGTQDHQVAIDTSEGMDFELLANGEYLLNCINADYMTKGEGDDKWEALKLTLDPVEEPNADYIYAMVFLPKNKGDEKKYKKSLFYFNLFKRAFGLGPSESFVPLDLVGREVYALVKQNADPEYGTRNEVAKWIPGDEVGNAGTPSY